MFLLAAIQFNLLRLVTKRHWHTSRRRFFLGLAHVFTCLCGKVVEHLISALDPPISMVLALPVERDSCFHSATIQNEWLFSSKFSVNKNMRIMSTSKSVSFVSRPISTGKEVNSFQASYNKEDSASIYYDTYSFIKMNISMRTESWKRFVSCPISAGIEANWFIASYIHED